MSKTKLCLLPVLLVIFLGIGTHMASANVRMTTDKQGNVYILKGTNFVQQTYGQEYNVNNQYQYVEKYDKDGKLLNIINIKYSIPKDKKLSDMFRGLDSDKNKRGTFCEVGVQNSIGIDPSNNIVLFQEFACAYVNVADSHEYNDRSWTDFLHQFILVDQSTGYSVPVGQAFTSQTRQDVGFAFGSIVLGSILPSEIIDPAAPKKNIASHGDSGPIVRPRSDRSALDGTYMGIYDFVVSSDGYVYALTNNFLFEDTYFDSKYNQNRMDNDIKRINLKSSRDSVSVITSGSRPYTISLDKDQNLIVFNGDTKTIDRYDRQGKKISTVATFSDIVDPGGSKLGSNITWPQTHIFFYRCLNGAIVDSDKNVYVSFDRGTKQNCISDVVLKDFKASGNSKTTQFHGKGLTSSPDASVQYVYFYQDVTPNKFLYITSNKTLLKDTIPPTEVGSIGLYTDITRSHPNIVWTDATDNESLSGYKIYRDNKQILDAKSSGNFIDFTNLSPNTEYTYEVAAYDANNNIGPKKSVKFTSGPEKCSGESFDIRKGENLYNTDWTPNFTINNISVDSLNAPHNLKINFSTISLTQNKMEDRFVIYKLIGNNDWLKENAEKDYHGYSVSPSTENIYNLDYSKDSVLFERIASVPIVEKGGQPISNYSFQDTNAPLGTSDVKYIIVALNKKCIISQIGYINLSLPSDVSDKPSISNLDVDTSGGQVYWNINFKRTITDKIISTVNITDNNGGRWSSDDSQYYKLNISKRYEFDTSSSLISRTLSAYRDNEITVKGKSVATKWPGGHMTIVFSDKTKIEFDIQPEGQFSYGEDLQPPSDPKNVTYLNEPPYKSINLYWESATDDTAVDHYEVYKDGKKVYSGSQWIYDSKNIKKYHYSDESITNNSVYKYTIYAVDQSGKKSKGVEITAGTYKDTEPPTIPKDLSATYTSSGIKLSWTQSVDNVAMAEYQIYRDDKLLAKANTNSYLDSTATQGNSYKYKVYAVDTSGNKSVGAEISKITKDTQAPASPTGLEFDNPKPYNSVILKWKASTDDVGIDHYEVYRDDKLLNGKISALTYTDSTVDAGASYKYSVYAIDFGGNKSKAADISVKTFKDNEPPRSINFFEATSLTAGMNLRWGLSSSDDVDHYELYKDGKLLYQSSSKAGDQYLDKDVKQDGIYVYVLYAFDYSKNRSKGIMIKKQYGSYNLNKSVYGKDIDSSDVNNIEGQSLPVATFTIDGIHDKSFTVGNTSYTYAWSSKNADTYSSTFTSNDTAKCGSGAFVANSASGSYTKASISTAMSGCTFTVTYTVKNSKTGKSASDTVIVRIQPANTTTTIVTKDTQAPSQPTGVSATTYSQNQINLKWSASTDNVGVTGYKIARNGVVVSNTAQTSISDTGLIAGTSYTYAVYAYDAAGNTSIPSAVVSARTQDSTTNTNTSNTTTNTNTNTTNTNTTTVTRPTPPTNLSGTAVSSSQINLTWSASTDSGVKNYNVYRDDSNVAIVSGTSYSDVNLDPNTTYTYKVIAYKPTSLYSDASNIVSVKTQPQGTPDPVVSITIDGVHDKTFTVGNSPYTYSWSGSNADTYTSTVTPSPASCGSTGAWIANSSSGTYSKDTISSGLAGCTFTVTYTGKNSTTGKSASDTVTVRIVSQQVNYNQDGNSLFASVINALHLLLRIR